MSTLSLSGANVSFGNTPVLKGIEVSVPSGECLALLGPLGCGKTTLLNVISGSVPLDNGALRVGDRVLGAPAAGAFVPMHRRGSSTVFQDFSLSNSPLLTTPPD